MDSRSIGSLTDELYEIRSQRLALEKEADGLKSRESAISSYLIKRLQADDTEAVRGTKAMFSLSHKVVPEVLDWESLYSFIVDNHAFSLLQKRIGSMAWGEYLDSGLVVPGTAALEVTKYNLTKTRG